MDAHKKVEILRQHETYCYQISFYLVQDEQLSIQSTTAALLELYGDPDFFLGNLETQKLKVKQVAIRSSLRVKASVYAEALT